MEALGALLGLVYILIIVITQLLFIILIPISIISIILDIIARKTFPFIYTVLMSIVEVRQRIFIDIRIPDDVDGFYGVNTPNILVFLITDIVIVIFLVLTILSLSKTERIKGIFNKLSNKVSKNGNKVIDYIKNYKNTAFNLYKKEEEQVEELEDKIEKKQEETPEEIEKETRTQIILETENSFKKKK